MLGADHHGYVNRLMAMCACFGDVPGRNLEILIGQMVNLLKDGQPLRMSKRAGTVVTLEDLVDAVGVDAGRYALARSSADSQIDIDLDLLVRRTNDNPVFYVQYAHARTCGVSRLAGEDGIRTADGFDPAVLTHETESALLATLGQFPSVVATAAEPARAAPGRPVPRDAGRYLPPLVRRLPGAPAVRRRGDHRPAPHPALAQRGDPHGARPRARPAGRQRAGAHVRAHEAGALHADGYLGPSWLRAPADVNALLPQVVRGRPSRGRRRAVGGRSRRRVAGGRARHARLRRRRGGLPGAGPGVPHRVRRRLPPAVRRRRRLLRRQGVPLHRGRPLDRRRGAEPRHLQRRRARRRPARRRAP
ncbi:hypothetical protein GCM10025868_38470 [Angustibacter aerolatus]|uniref:arginine--tRNA ligase n=1 Tax=Angustibacter aerolatus TaxID=1162965 RepID=A0ABQ6JLE6_9ACTN|nr:hypothetical protein GCM10025868_38470 [Angustibacter aerolatus]